MNQYVAQVGIYYIWKHNHPAKNDNTNNNNVAAAAAAVHTKERQSEIYSETGDSGGFRYLDIYLFVIMHYALCTMQYALFPK